MTKQNLVIYSIPTLSEILKELEDKINFNVIEISNYKEFNNQKLNSSLVLTKKK